MSVQEMKALAHQYIDEVDDERTIRQIIALLKHEDQHVAEEPGIYFTQEGKNLLDQALREAEQGNYMTGEDAQAYFHQRFSKD